MTKHIFSSYINKLIIKYENTNAIIHRLNANKKFFKFIPLIGAAIGMNFESFGAWSSMAVHDTGSVIGTAIAFGGDAVETATILKLSRTIWLIPLIIILGIFYQDK